MDEKIEEIAYKAREILRKIPFAGEGQIDFQTVEYGDPTVTYESSGCGFVQVVNERGQERRTEIAGSFEEMVNYFVDSAITDYAYRGICLKYRAENAISCQTLKDDIDYIADQGYTDTPGGGMYNLEASMEKVRERIKRISACSSELKEAFLQYEKYYRLLKEKKPV